MNRRIFLKLAGVGVPLAGLKAALKRPNIILFMTDDQGYGDLGCYGHPKIKSPNIDNFAKRGLKFSDGYAACPVCSPSRSAMLTGRTPYRNGVFTWIPPHTHLPYLRKSEITLARVLKANGYRTCHVGKWHLSGDLKNPHQPQPNDHGYEHWMATQNNASPNHVNPNNYYRNGEAVGELKGESAVLMAEEALGWLRKKDKRPFFLTFWTHEPHMPVESSRRFLDIYKSVTDDINLRHYYGNISQIDHAFGMLMKGIKEMGHEDNTFVVYTSDNGPEGKDPDDKKKRSRGVTGGLRARKRSIYEGGIRVPTIFRWPGHIKPGSGSAEPVNGTDYFPTVCEITGVSLPKDRVIDGTSLVSLFRGKKLARKIPLFWRYHSMAMREGDWKIISKGKGRYELFNLRKDRAETRDLKESEPRKFESLKKRLIELNTEIENEGPGWWKSEANEGRPVTPDKDGNMTLKAGDAKTQIMKFQAYTGVLDHIDEFGRAEWEVRGIKPGKYRVAMTFAHARSPGEDAKFLAGNEFIIINTKILGKRDYGFPTVEIGTLNLKNSSTTFVFEGLRSEPVAASLGKKDRKKKKQKKKQRLHVSLIKTFTLTKLN